MPGANLIVDFRVSAGIRHQHVHAGFTRRAGTRFAVIASGATPVIGLRQIRTIVASFTTSTGALEAGP